jgi:nucleoside-diphosphate-sugar epimerase
MERCMSVLVIGGAGYIGDGITDLLPNCDIFDNLTYDDRYLKDVTFIYGDVRNLEHLDKIVHNYDTLIVLAGIVGDAACAVNPEFTYDTNVKHVKWLADNYNGKIIYTSTCSVYGMNDNLLNESSPTNPLSIYAETKLEAEQYLLSKKPNSVIFRLGTLFGLSGKYSRPRLDLVVNVLTLRATRGEILHVFGGDQWRPILHVKDVAHAVVHSLLMDVPGGVYNLCRKNVTIKDAANVIRSVIPCSIEYQDIMFEDRRNYKVSDQKILDTGFVYPEHLTVTKGVSEMAKVFKEGRVKNPYNALYHNGNHIGELHEK